MLASIQAGDTQDLLIPQHELGLICARQRVNMAISELKRFGLVRSEVHKGLVLVDAARLRARDTRSILDPWPRCNLASGWHS